MHFKAKVFDLVLTRTIRALVMIVSGFSLLAFFCGQVSDVVAAVVGLSERSRRLWVCVLVAVGAYGLYRFVKRDSADPTRITVKMDELIILHQKTGEEKEIKFDSILAYRFVDFNNQATLRLKLTDGRKLKFKVNGLLHEEKNLVAMVSAFEAALSQHYGALTQISSTVREKTLFEKPISTVLLAVFAGLLVWITWDQYTNHRHVSGSLFSLYSVFSAYFVAWLAASKKRWQ